jgi:methylated-DNA-[protein]-cysteine S-methyltransferase
MKLLVDRVASPIGTILLVSDGEALCTLDFADNEAGTHRALRAQFGSYTLNATANAGGISAKIEAYFLGDLAVLDGIPVRTGGTAFQREVWAALREIPVGTTTSYGQLAAKLGRPQACRAVGLANGSNPVSIVVPCHRVIGSDGRLTGYGGGIERKQWLLAHEKAGNLLPLRIGAVA